MSGGVEHSLYAQISVCRVPNTVAPSCGMLGVISKPLLMVAIYLDLSLEESIRTLFSYSLVKRGSCDDSFSIHDLVHSWARLRLKSELEKEIEKAREAFDKITSGVGISGHRRAENWIFEQQVMPHIETVTEYITQYLAMGNMEIQEGY